MGPTVHRARCTTVDATTLILPIVSSIAKVPTSRGSSKVVLLNEEVLFVHVATHTVLLFSLAEPDTLHSSK